jgi:hypothetical protein
MPRNMVLHGEYATLSYEEGPVFTPTFAREMPTVFLPIALVFRLLGVGLLQARMVMAVYLALTVLAMALVAGHLYGRRIGIVAGFLFLVTTYSEDLFTSSVYLGRQAMGEVPGLLFFLIGCLLWFKALAKRSSLFLVLSGVAFGLAIVTKSWFAFIIWPTLALLWLADVLRYRQLGLRYVVLPVASSILCVALWMGMLYLILGPQDFAVHLAIVRSASSTSAAMFSVRRAVSGIRFLLRSDFIIWGLPGLIYCAVLALDRKRRALTAVLMAISAVVSLLWYLLASIAWARYAFPAFAISNLFVAKLLSDLAGGLQWSQLRQLFRSEGTADGIWRLGGSLLLLLFVGSSFLQTAKQVVTAGDSSPQQMAEYVDAHVSHDALIETAEWEISFLTEHERYHHPPSSVVDALTARLYLGVQDAVDPYDLQGLDPDYVIVGPFAAWTSLYRDQDLGRTCTQATSFGEYVLYQCGEGSNR